MSLDRIGDETRTATRAGDWDLEDQPPVQLPERWRLVRRLGSGGQASVWLARDEKLNEWVAIKVLVGPIDEIRLQRLRREVTIGRSLAHPGLVRIYELMELDERHAVVMEWLEGGSLADKLRDGPLDAIEVEAVAGKVLAALAYMHERGIVHRDVKPSNLLLASDGDVRLADLGLARPVMDSGALTKTQMTPGTPNFMSPEQFRGLELGPASDLYSLGATLYQLLTGDPPFTGSSDYDVADQHLRATARDPRRRIDGCPTWLSRFILRLLEKQASDRWADAGAALRAFERRRRLTSPRIVRRAVAGLTAVVLASIAMVWFVSTIDQSPAYVESMDREMIVRTESGRELWRKQLSTVPAQWLIADVLGEGSPQVYVSSQAPSSETSEWPEVVVHGADGAVRHEIDVEDVLGQAFPRFDSRQPRVRLKTADQDGDARPELLLMTHHRALYPSAVSVWNPRRTAGLARLFVNSGHIKDAVFADLDGDGDREIIVAGINNVLGFQVFLAIVEANQKGNIAGCSPDLVQVARDRKPLRGVTFTLLGPMIAGPWIVNVGDEDITFEVSGEKILLDRNGNPGQSLLHGEGAEGRKRFWSDIVFFSHQLTSGNARPEDAHQLLDRHPRVVSEAPMRAGGALLLGLNLARAGWPDAAGDFLAEEAARMPRYTDLQLRLAEYYLIAGRRLEGRSVLRGILRLPASGRGHAGARALLAREVALAGDKVAYADLLDVVHASEGPPKRTTATGGETEVLWAFYRGNWNDPMLDSAAPTWGYPENAVFRLWASLVRGSSVNGVLEGVESLSQNPELGLQANLLRALCLIRLGQPERALAFADQSLGGIEREAGSRYEMYVWLPVAHYVAAESAVAVGDVDLAEFHRKRTVELAPNSWFAHQTTPQD